MRIQAISAALISLTLNAMSAVPVQSTFAVYLITGLPDARNLVQNPGQWKELALSNTPVISDVDVISYDFSKHAVRLRPEAIKRLPKPSVFGIPFVVVVNGDRIYPGAFYSSFSSVPFGLPVIVVSRPEPDAQDVLNIERAYPASHAVGVDPRSDERIRSALSSLKKLAAPNR
jgi:hypothetical protein